MLSSDTLLANNRVRFSLQWKTRWHCLTVTTDIITHLHK